MSEMTLPSRYRFRNSNPGGLRPRSRRLPTILSFTSGGGRNIFVSFEPPRAGKDPSIGPPPNKIKNNVLYQFILSVKWKIVPSHWAHDVESMSMGTRFVATLNQRHLRVGDLILP